jgi:hypothetical protein
MRRTARFGIVGLSVLLLILVSTQMFSVSPTLAATLDKLIATCSFVGLRGRTEVNTAYVRVQVVLASNLNTVIAQQVVRTRPRAGAIYSALLDIRSAHLANGTRLIISAGEWDGTKYLRPATLTGVDCGRAGTPSPTPTFVASPTLPPISATPTPIASPTLPPFSPTPPPR